MVYTFILCLILLRHTHSYDVGGNISNHIIVLLTQQLSLLVCHQAPLIYKFRYRINKK